MILRIRLPDGLLDDVVSCVGMTTIFAFVCGLIVLIVYATYRCFISLKDWYTVRHRFDKKPIAKCYCKDCKYWTSQSGHCNYFQTHYTADNWFCWNAEPINGFERKRRETLN